MSVEMEEKPKVKGQVGEGEQSRLRKHRCRRNWKHNTVD